VVMQLNCEPFVKELGLLLIGVNVVTSVLCRLLNFGCTHTQNGSPSTYPGTPKACGTWCPLTGGGHRKQHGTHPMVQGDLRAVLRCKMPTKPPAGPISCWVAYRVFWFSMQCNRPNFDSVVWSKSCASNRSFATEKIGG
jgi:hypothetical protein